MLFSVLSTIADGAGTSLRFGGAVMIHGEPAALTRIAPGQRVDLGATRFETVEGGYPEAMYAYRKMLDEKGCRFPKDFNPPVHWEQLYDMPNAWDDRPRSTRRRSSSARPPRDGITIAKRSISIPVGTAISPVSSGARSGSVRESSSSTRCSRNTG